MAVSAVPVGGGRYRAGVSLEMTCDPCGMLLVSRSHRHDRARSLVGLEVLPRVMTHWPDLVATRRHGTCLAGS